MTGKGFGPDPKLGGLGDPIVWGVWAVVILIGWFLLAYAPLP